MWHFGYTRKIDKCDILMTHLYAIAIGLELCLAMGYTKIELYFDLKAAKLLLGKKKRNIQLKYANTVFTCKAILFQLQTCKSEHRYHEINAIAYHYTHFAHAMEENEVFFCGSFV